MWFLHLGGKAMRILLILSVLFGTTHAWSAPAPHQKIHESFVFSGTPTSDLIAQWSALPGTRSYLFQLPNPSPEELRALAVLRGADLLQIEASSYPDRDTLDSWKLLARHGVQFIAFDLQLPTAEQLELLNEIGFSRLIFLLSYIPDLEESARLAELRAPFSITFAGASYPRYDDKIFLLAIPKTVPLTFAASYWPWYSHMDLFNMLPHAQKLQIIGAFPSDDHLPYLQNIRGLREIVVETDFEPSDPEIWKKMATGSDQTMNRTIKWISKDRVPTKQALDAFAETGSVRLTIDQDYDLSEEERTRLTESAIPVEWVHAAPVLKAF
ncbi:MAG TPA: hypothetical protein VJB59_05395 [Bdellovibrionota bacterium]|nr:hypothetical protein [Bdellovibrionota bacterium]